MVGVHQYFFHHVILVVCMCMFMCNTFPSGISPPYFDVCVFVCIHVFICVYTCTYVNFKCTIYPILPCSLGVFVCLYRCVLCEYVCLCVLVSSVQQTYPILSCCEEDRWTCWGPATISQVLSVRAESFHGMKVFTEKPLKSIP